MDAFEVKGNLTASRLWKLVGYMGVVGAFGILAYYMVIGGWVINYIVNVILGVFHLSELNLGSLVTKDLTERFYAQHIENSPLENTLYTFIFVAVNWVILRRGLIEGIEKSIRFLMPALFICLFIMVVRNLFLEGAPRAISFYLEPDFSAISPTLFLYVLGQVFFALSIGFGVMITLSSHLSKNENLPKTATITGVINTLIAIFCGFMIFPTLFSAGLEPDAGPSLVFKTLPIAFSSMGFGSAFAVIFFSLLIVAALTTSITIYQVLISVFQEKFGLSKNMSVNLTLGGIFFLGNIPSILSYGPWSDITFYGRNIFDSFDFISGNIFFVLTALLSCIFVGWILKKDAIRELDSGYSQGPSRLGKIWFFYIRYIIPVIIVAIFIGGFFISV